MACLWRCIIALCALVWLLPTVDEHVLFQNKSSTKWLSTFCTFVHSLPNVDGHKVLQISSVTKWFLTFWAGVGLFSTVSDHVLLQVIGATKWFIAVDTIAAYMLALSSFPVQLIKLSLRMCHASKAFYGIYFVTRSFYGQKCRFNIKLRKWLIFFVFPLNM